MDEIRTEDGYVLWLRVLIGIMEYKYTSIKPQTLAKMKLGHFFLPYVTILPARKEKCAQRTDGGI